MGEVGDEVESWLGQVSPVGMTGLCLVVLNDMEVEEVEPTWPPCPLQLSSPGTRATQKKWLFEVELLLFHLTFSVCCLASSSFHPVASSGRGPLYQFCLTNIMVDDLTWDFVSWPFPVF